MVSTRIIHGRRALQDLLRQVRVDAGLSQRAVAARLHQAQSYVSKYETGERRLDLAQLDEVCEAIGIPLEDLVRRYKDLVARDEDA